MSTIKKIIAFIWQLPQNIAGLVVWAVLLIRGRIVRTDTMILSGQQGTLYITIKEPAGSFCLGNYIFIRENHNEYTIAHEYGHSLQSHYLGPLYLLTVGLYSVVFCYWWDRWFHKTWPEQKRLKWYYSRWCEAWADRLGGVKRNSK